MGRPREHDDRTAATLLAAAERTVQEQGVEALSVRGVASDVGTTTRAVYSVFGSKDGLIAALGAHAFDLLGVGLKALPTTDDPRSDLIEAGLMFRRFAIEHPSLFVIGVQRGLHPTGAPAQVRAAANTALEGLQVAVGRLADAELLGGRTIYDAALQFHALCEGLAALELRGVGTPDLAPEMWKQALTALVTGFASPASPQVQSQNSSRPSRRSQRAHQR
jgi:AcrR family transcriptional regulator